MVATNNEPDFEGMAKDRFLVFDLIQVKDHMEQNDFRWDICDRMRSDQPIKKDRSNERNSGLLDAAAIYAKKHAIPIPK